MALPGNLTTRVVKGQYLDLTGAYVVGSINFSVDATFVDPAAAVTIVANGSVITAELDNLGSFTQTLMTTDDTDLNPTGFRYKVVENFVGGLHGRTYYLDVPGISAVPIDLSSVVTDSVPSSGATTYIPLSQKGVTNGVASLDAGALVPIAQIPPLPASKITSGTFGTAQIPALPYVPTVGGTLTGTLNNTGSAVSSILYAGIVTGDAFDRVRLNADGSLAVGPGSATRDTTLVRTNPAEWSMNGKLVLGADPTANLGATTKQYVDTLINPLAMPGIYVPPGWGTFWRTARNQAKLGTGKAVVAAVGSSTFAGLYSSNPYSKGLIGCMRTSLQTQYGDGGTGYYTSLWNNTSLTGGGEAAGAISVWNTNGVLISMTGTGWSEGGNLYGPGCEYMATSTPADALTFTVRGTQVVIYTLGKDGGRPNWTYSIDGAAAVTVTDSASTGLTAIATRITGLTNASHTVKVTHAGASGAFLSVNGVAGENTAGVIVNNFARSGATTSSFIQPGRITWNGGPDYPADLLLYCAGANDASVGLSGDSWASNVRQFLATVKDGTSVGGVNALGNTDVVIVMQHIGKFDNTNWRYQDYVARARGLCDEYGAALVNLHAVGRGSWNYWNSLSYWGSSTNPASFGTDSIHLADAGHQASANAILPLLTS